MTNNLLLYDNYCTALSFRTSDDLVKGVGLSGLDARKQPEWQPVFLVAVFHYPYERFFIISLYPYNILASSIEQSRKFHLLLGEAGLADDAVGVVDEINKARHVRPQEGQRLPDRP